MSNFHIKHSLFEKCLFRSICYGCYFIGAFAIFQENIWLAALYIVFVLFSLEYVFRTFCVHCPYPGKHSDCLMRPYEQIKKHIKPDQKPMTVIDRMSFPMLMIVLLPLIPQYWLSGILKILERKCNVKSQPQHLLVGLFCSKLGIRS